ncbi:SDR family NAD(P)-dependent oxidoreductase [Paenibacillus sp. GD4]|uniref:SDR family NAD(P)-dependent oxidoreductase n=1 Tax=Paenibacillus sp. GD4 TaxID=3068890 RepID=UPI00279688D2|nr:SDR family NAD(P)-dependent oxidoreductase [Paenibacillus sp. GD4]MDQ1910086.1 SDR family NAD(P)-dependent oxidoreductase [Paenibacillus sp. GD4]
MKAYIITGASRGLGEAMAARMLNDAEPKKLICVSRTVHPAPSDDDRVTYLTQDLSAGHELEALMQRLFERLPSGLTSLYLINNAGVLGPIAPAADSEPDAVSLNVQVNLLAPMLLTSAFIRLSAKLPIDKRVLHISSGAGRKPYAGWSSYCASKAGLDHYTRCVGLEEEGKAHGVRIASLAPGVIDTQMQQEIRSSSPEAFPQLDRFLELKRSGQLTSPEQAAEQVLRFLHSDSCGFGSIADVRDLQ